jgi:hypothetical protein
VDLAEASGATYVGASEAGPAHVLVVADSGNRGELVAIDAEDGLVVGRGRLPLDPAVSDDLEGFSRIDDRYVALTSGGRVFEFGRKGLMEFVAAAKPYAIGKIGAKDDLICQSAMATNCGRNWEGLCLRATTPAKGECAGFAASNRDGELVCLVREDGRLRADPARVIAITRGEALTGCAIVGDVVYAGTNLFDAARVYRVTGFDRPGKVEVEPLGSLGSGFPEAIAASPTGDIYRFSDLAARPSSMDRFGCR